MNKERLKLAALDNKYVEDKIKEIMIEELE